MKKIDDDPKLKKKLEKLKKEEIKKEKKAEKDTLKTKRKSSTIRKKVKFIKKKNLFITLRMKKIQHGDILYEYQEVQVELVLIVLSLISQSKVLFMNMSRRIIKKWSRT